ncbi:type I 3-dehydroquinate dehydratase [Ornithinibacillus sp. 179-J 7C1 HS]|uniref:type I 3-dehydroquinate dehydratase n=1 Tax=Ornithinibacillus sp. 179-J 7C1 HS TaxID=3142384 RepID=UPI00399F5FBF
MKTIRVRDITIGEGLPKIIVPLVSSLEQELLSEIKKVLAMNPDIIEWRVDSYKLVENLNSVLKTLKKLRGLIKNVPLLFTFRTFQEGGKQSLSMENYEHLLEKVIQSKLVDLIDVQLFLEERLLKKLVSLANENEVLVVMSNHDFEKTPEKDEIIFRLRKMQELGADIPKIAVMPNGNEDVLTILDATNTMKEKFSDRPFITVSMGRVGLISRLTGHVFGSAATFASGVNDSAPGQITITELKNVLETIYKYS